MQNKNKNEKKKPKPKIKPTTTTTSVQYYKEIWVVQKKQQRNRHQLNQHQNNIMVGLLINYKKKTKLK